MKSLAEQYYLPVTDFWKWMTVPTLVTFNKCSQELFF